MHPEVIINLGGEGGGYTIESINSTEGRLFRIESSGTGWDPDTDEEVSFNRHTAWRTLLDDVFAELNPRWYLLCPIEVHQEFAQVLWMRYIEACRSFNDKKPKALKQWSAALLGREISTKEFAEFASNSESRTNDNHRAD